MSASAGWNDPPQVSYSASESSSASLTNATSRSKISLNKRVPFPLNGPAALLVPMSDASANNDGGPKVQLMPPADSATVTVATSQTALNVTTSSLKPISAGPTCSSNDQEPEAEITSASELYRETVDALKRLLGLCLPTLQKRTAEDIAKRLAVLSNMWVGGKLSEDVRNRMHRLTKALQNGNHDEANKVHLALIVDHVGQVSPWMVGIKHLIHESRNLSPDATQKQALVMDPSPTPSDALP